MKKLFLLLLFYPIYSITLFSQEHIVKFATVAPEGSTWANVMKEYDAAIRKESNGRLGFKIYFGGIQGDEKDVLRKIKLGQLHSCGITGVGINEIAKKVRILDSPFLFNSYEETDAVINKFSNDFRKNFEDENFILLGFAEVGFVYTFSNSEIKNISDLQKLKMWMWEGYPIAQSMFQEFKVSPISLSITEVLTSLQTNLINAIYSPPLAALALQWFTKVKYMLNIPLANSQGAIVISKNKFEKLPSDLQEILLRNGKTYMEKLTKLSREDNKKSIETLKKNGIKITEITDKKLLSDFIEIGKRTRRKLVGKLYDEKFLNEVENEVTKIRSGKK